MRTWDKGRTLPSAKAKWRGEGGVKRQVGGKRQGAVPVGGKARGRQRSVACKRETRLPLVQVSQERGHKKPKALTWAGGRPGRGNAHGPRFHIGGRQAFKFEWEGGKKSEENDTCYMATKFFSRKRARGGNIKKGGTPEHLSVEPGEPPLPRKNRVEGQRGLGFFAPAAISLTHKEKKGERKIPRP